MFLLRPPNLVRRGPFLVRKHVCNSQETGVRTRRAAIVNHPAVLNILRVVNLLRVVFLVRRGPLGKGRARRGMHFKGRSKGHCAVRGIVRAPLGICQMSIRDRTPKSLGKQREKTPRSKENALKRTAQRTLLYQKRYGARIAAFSYLCCFLPLFPWTGKPCFSNRALVTAIFKAPKCL